MLREKKPSRARLTSWVRPWLYWPNSLICPKMIVCPKEVGPVVDFQTLLTYEITMKRYESLAEEQYSIK